MNTTSLTFTENELALLARLIAGVERELDKKFQVWGIVYLPNLHLTRTDVATLSSLTKKGVYKDNHGEFKGVYGDVLLASPYPTPQPQTAVEDALAALVSWDGMKEAWRMPRKAPRWPFWRWNRSRAASGL